MRLVRKPFKGTVAFEWQVGALVMQFCHKPFKHATFWRFNFFRDPFWK